MTDQSPTRAPFAEWVDFAFAHIMNAVDTALDELDRDNDFLTPDDPKVPSPQGRDREVAKELAIARFVNEVIALQES